LFRRYLASVCLPVQKPPNKLFRFPGFPTKFGKIRRDVNKDSRLKDKDKDWTCKDKDKDLTFKS